MQNLGERISQSICFADGVQWQGEVQNKDVCDSGLAVKTQTFPATE